MFMCWLNRWRERKRLEQRRRAEAMRLLLDHAKGNVVLRGVLWMPCGTVGSVYHFWVEHCSPPIYAAVDLDKQQVRVELGPGR